MSRRTVVIFVGAALLLTVGALSPPMQASGQEFGGYADSLVFSVVPQDQAVRAVSGGDIDMYGFPLDTATDRQAARDDPNINALRVFGRSRGILLNPCEPSDESFNPFTIREIREAMHWALDREFLASEIAGGFAVPLFTAYLPPDVDYAADPEFFAELQAKYEYDPGRADAAVRGAMSRIPGASFDPKTDQWLMNGNNIEVIIVQRVEDFRFEIGAYVATSVEKLGFTPVLDPSTFAEALTKVYFSDARIGQWHMYTEGWGSSGLVQFEDTQANFFYNGDFGSAIWDCYEPPPSLTVPCKALSDGDYGDADERRELVRRCITEGMREAVRIFILADYDVYALNRAVSNTVISPSEGLLQPFALRTTVKDGRPGGPLRVGQPVHTGSAWNLYGGFRDVYSMVQAFSITDFGTHRHPRFDTIIPIRADFMITSVGPDAVMPVPTTALTFDVLTNTFLPVPSGTMSSAFVDFTLKFGEWHHGEMMSMDDVLAHIALLSRLASGDLASKNPNAAEQIYLVRWDSAFRGIELLDSDNIRVWFDTWHPEETFIADRADVFPWYPWELNALMTESVLANETAFDDSSADLLGIEPLDLAKGPTFGFLDPRLAVNQVKNAIPAFLSPWVTDEEAEARWASLDRWRNPSESCIDGPTWTCNFYVSQGPYVLDRYETAPEGALYTAKRSGYPLEQDAWDHLGPLRIPTVEFRRLPTVVQTLPVTFEFTTSLNGEPYDRIAKTEWELVDSQGETLYEGNSERTSPGKWAITLSPIETAALFGGTYELKTVVVGEETPLPIPVITRLPVYSVSLYAFILGELSVYPDPSVEHRDPFEDIAEVTRAADRAAWAARNVVNTGLTIAVIALAVALGTLATLVSGLRRQPPM